MNNPIIYKVCLGIGISATGLGLLLIIPEMAKFPALTITKESPSVAFPTNSELRAIKLKNGQNVAVIKTWGYKYNPMIPPTTDLKVLKDAIATMGYDFILLESDSNPAILGWYMQPNKLGTWQLYQVTQEFKNRNKELFDHDNY